MANVDKEYGKISEVNLIKYVNKIYNYVVVKFIIWLLSRKSSAKKGLQRLNLMFAAAGL